MHSGRAAGSFRRASTGPPSSNTPSAFPAAFRQARTAQVYPHTRHWSTARRAALKPHSTATAMRTTGTGAQCTIPSVHPEPASPHTQRHQHICRATKPCSSHTFADSSQPPCTWPAAGVGCAREDNQSKKRTKRAHAAPESTLCKKVVQRAWRTPLTHTHTVCSFMNAAQSSRSTSPAVQAQPVPATQPRQSMCQQHSPGKSVKAVCLTAAGATTLPILWLCSRVQQYPGGGNVPSHVFLPARSSCLHNQGMTTVLVRNLLADCNPVCDTCVCAPQCTAAEGQHHRLSHASQCTAAEGQHHKPCVGR
jgi:hypothetical protein